jgi:hypothetical protein
MVACGCLLHFYQIYIIVFYTCFTCIRIRSD